MTKSVRVPFKRLLIVVAVCLLTASGCMKRLGHLTPLPGSRAAGFAGGPGASLAAVPMTTELWVLARGDLQVGEPAADEPGSGALVATIEEQEIPLPLERTEVDAAVSGYLGSVEVRQRFHNPYSSKIEAVYLFPLPHNAAINEFIMAIGERRIRGIIRPRDEAEQIYREAKRQGYVASLLTEERPNIFTQSVANIEPGKVIDVSIRYFQTLDYHDGWYEFAFPMVVGPRFNPQGSTGGIGAVARGQSGASGQTTEVSYLRPGERSSHFVTLKLEVDAGLPIEETQCRTHKVATETLGPGRVRVALDPSERLPNRDFVFRYRVAGDTIKSGLVTHGDHRGEFFTLMLYPPREAQDLPRQALELVFVLDSSGSMRGRPIEQAKAAIQRALTLLQPGDSFQLITFSMKASQLGPTPLEASPANTRRGQDYLQRLKGEGGTMMIEGIKAALDFQHDPERLRFVCFLTDGFIGNEAEILAEIRKRLGAARIFSFGIGSSVNRYLLDQMALEGNGAVAYLGLNESAAAVMEDFFGRIAHPAMTDLEIDWGESDVQEVYPREAPDLFVGRPVILTGRSGTLRRQIRIRGQVAGRRNEIVIPAEETAATHPALPSIWARMKIADLSRESIHQPDTDLPEAIQRVALDFGLMSAFTAFVAVDSTRVTEGTTGTTVPVAVPVPEGVSYTNTVIAK